VDALVVESLEFRYPDGRHALRGVDLTVGAGEHVAILGPNGAGKTTLALHLNGVYRGQGGTVSVAGVVLNEETLPTIRQLVGIVFQDPNDQLFMPTVEEDVAFGPANLGLTGDVLDDRVEATLKRVGLDQLADRPPHHLSGGEKRLAAIATVLAMAPEVVVLDEPGSGLDPTGRRELISLLAGLDKTLIVITHDLPLALELCPRSVILDGGVVVADMVTAELLRNEALLRSHRLELPFGFELSQS
jgi:cobalt/nickel transport system ATP-binding protein